MNGDDTLHVFVCVMRLVTPIQSLACATLIRPCHRRSWGESSQTDVGRWGPDDLVEWDAGLVVWGGGEGAGEGGKGDGYCLQCSASTLSHEPEPLSWLTLYPLDLAQVKTPLTVPGVGFGTPKPRSAWAGPGLWHGCRAAALSCGPLTTALCSCVPAPTTSSD